MYVFDLNLFLLLQTIQNSNLMDSKEKKSEDVLKNWSPYAKVYDPLKIGSIDGTDIAPHDRAIVRAISSEYFPNRHVKGRPENTVFVARLSPKTTKDAIKELFSTCGKIHRFRLVRDIVTGTPKGYAFIEYEQESSAEAAYKKLNKYFLNGSEIFVDFECERLLKGWKPRRLGGGFGGRKESGQLRFGGRDRPFRKPIIVEALRKDRLTDEEVMKKDKQNVKRDEKKKK